MKIESSSLVGQAYTLRSTVQRMLGFAALLAIELLGTGSGAWHAAAASYFVSSSTGNDAWSGRASAPVGSPPTDGPWRTLAKLASAVLVPGDVVRLRCGDVWRETLVISSSGVAAAPLVFEKYGDNCQTGAKPVITGADRVISWEPFSGAIHVANVDLEVVQLFSNGVRLRPARYPNAGFLRIAADSSPQESDYLIGDADLRVPAGNEIYGADIHVLTQDWMIEDRRVASYDYPRRRVNLDAPTQYPAKKGYGYYLENKLWMLDQPGEFVYDRKDRRLFVWLPDGSNPNNSVLEASVRANAIYANGRSALTIRDLRLEKAARDGVHLNAPDGFTLERLAVAGSGRTGVNVTTVAPAVPRGQGLIQNNVIQDSQSNGVSVVATPNVTIRQNRVSNTGNPVSPRSMHAGIDGVSNGLVIQDNLVENSGYVGIYFLKASRIEDNVVRNSCLILNDCGALYTFNPDPAGDVYGTLVRQNLIEGVVGNVDGTANSKPFAHGIYLDSYTNGVDVEYNTFASGESGVFIHNAHHNAIVGNVLFGNRRAELLMMEGGDVETLYGNRIVGNQLVSLTDQPNVALESTFADTNFADFSVNRYGNLFSPYLFSSVSSQGVATYSLKSWQQALGFDRDGSSFDAFSVASFRALTPVSGNLVINGSFDGGVGDWRLWSDLPGVDLSHAQGCHPGGCARLTAGTGARNLLISNNFSVTAGQLYAFRFDARSRSGPQHVRVAFRQGGPSSYEPIGLDQAVTVSDSWQSFSLIAASNTSVEPTLLSNGARADFSIGTEKILEVDNVSIEQVALARDDTTAPVPGDLTLNGGFDLNIANWRAWSSDGSGAATWVATCPNGGCGRFASGGAVKTLFSTSPFGMVKGRHYAVSFDIRAESVSQSIRVAVRQNGPDAYAPAGLDRIVPLELQWSRWTMVFPATLSVPVSATSSGARLDFEVNPGNTIWVDNVRVREAIVEPNATDPNKNALLLMNTSNTSKSFACPSSSISPAKCSEFVRFTDESPVTWPVVVPAKRSEVLIWANNPFREK